METTDEVRAEVSKVSPKPGELLIVTFTGDPPPGTMQAGVHMVQRAMEEAGINGVGIVAVWPGMTITEASDDLLAQFGLRRINAPMCAPPPMLSSSFNFASSGLVL